MWIHFLSYKHQSSVRHLLTETFLQGDMQYVKESNFLCKRKTKPIIGLFLPDKARKVNNVLHVVCHHTSLINLSRFCAALRYMYSRCITDTWYNSTCYISCPNDTWYASRPFESLSNNINTLWQVLIYFFILTFMCYIVCNYLA